MQARSGLLHCLVLALCVSTVLSRHHHYASKHHGRSTAGRGISSKASAWNDLPDLEEFEYRLGRIKSDLDSEIGYHSELGDKEHVQQDRRRRREAKVIGSVLATGAKNKKTYPAVQSEDDWERDLVTDDDDKLPETLKKYVADPTIKGTGIAPKVESNEDFADDYPVDDDRDQAEEARLQRAHEAAEEVRQSAKEAADKAQKVADSKRQDLKKAANKTKKAKKKTQAAQEKYSKAKSMLDKAKQDVKQGIANETRIKNLDKDIHQKVKHANKAVEELDKKLYKQSMSCHRQDTDVGIRNISIAQKYRAQEAHEKKLKELLKSEKLANNEVKRHQKALQDAETLLEKLEAATKSAEEIKEAEPKSSAVGCHLLPVICLSLIAAVLGAGKE